MALYLDAPVARSRVIHRHLLHGVEMILAPHCWQVKFGGIGRGVQHPRLIVCSHGVGDEQIKIVDDGGVGVDCSGFIGPHEHHPQLGYICGHADGVEIDVVGVGDGAGEELSCVQHIIRPAHIGATIACTEIWPWIVHVICCVHENSP